MNIGIYTFSCPNALKRASRSFYVFPDGVSVRADDHTAAHAGVVNQFGFF